MSRIRTLALGAALFVGTATVATAQAAQHSHDSTSRHGKMAGKAMKGDKAHGRKAGGQMMKGITLTDAQKTQMQAIRARYQPQHQAMREARQGQGRPDSTAMAGMRNLMQREHADMRAVLTPTQQSTFDTNVSQMRDRGQKARGQRGEGRRRQARAARRGA